MTPTRPAVLALAFAAVSASAQTAPGDTIHLSVGSRQVNARLYAPHAARVRVTVDGTVTNEWTNELTLGDSAGKKVMRWVTKTLYSPTGVKNELRQTYDAETLQPYSLSSESTNGAFTKLVFVGNEVRGTRKGPNDTAPVEVNVKLTRAGFMAGASDLIPAAVGLRAGLVMTAPVWSQGMADSDDRIFSVTKDTVVDVEGTNVRSWKVEERRRVDRSLVANWYLLDKSPYMVYGEAMLPNGKVRKMSEVEIPMSKP